jgi:hypothetical protein
MPSPKAYLYSVDPEHCSADKWDYGLLSEIFERNQVEQIRVEELPKSAKAFVIIPGPQNLRYIDEINKQLGRIKRVVLFITGDEERVFPVDAISHPNIEIWVHYLHSREAGIYNSLPIGTPIRIKDNVPIYPEKIHDAYFGGQITHTRRKDIAQTMPYIENSLFEPTKGFAQGGTPEEYYSKLSQARFAPCPAGAVVVDTFRFFEAIEMLSLPIGDLKNSRGEHDDFLTYALDNPPCPVVYEWEELQGIINMCKTDYHKRLHTIVCWWIKYKRDLSFKIMEQVNAK